MIGFININKPSGVTSNSIVCGVKKILKIKKVGHFGTLDPLASGVLPIAVGKATRLFDYFLNKDKIYIATFEFGYQTDTLDSEGEILKTTDVIPTRQNIENVLKEFIGKQDQIPPMFSAKNINGVRAYELARKGIEVELKTKEIEIFDIRLLGQENSKVYKFYIHCSSGTYIRSIARDLGLKLNSYATMIGLIRQKSGYFELDNAINLDENIQNNIIPIDKVLSNLPKINLGKECYVKLQNGVQIEYENDFEEALIYCNNELFGLGTCQNNMIKLKIYLKE